MERQRENSCVSAGCSGACCRNITFFLRENPTNLFEGAREVSPDKTSEVLESPGVYFQAEQDRFFVAVVGKCPNLGQDLNCKIYENRPTACRALQLGKSECTKARAFQGLPSVIEVESIEIY